MKNWNSFKKRILINKPLEVVYRSWTTKSEIESWFLEKADFIYSNGQRKPDEFAQKGDKFAWKWNNWDFTEKGQILEANGIDSISFTFGSGGNVHINLKPTNFNTEITLIQDEIPTDEKSKMDIYVGCITGWTFWLTNLKAYLEHNITLHAKGLKQNETSNLVNS
jgi:uncharacterized protein YndB with AHSA1/START domain